MKIYLLFYFYLNEVSKLFSPFKFQQNGASLPKKLMIYHKPKSSSNFIISWYSYLSFSPRPGMHPIWVLTDQTIKPTVKIFYNSFYMESPQEYDPGLEL